MSILTAEILRELSLPERKELILQKTLAIDATQITEQELHKAYKLSHVIYPILPAYFQYQIEQDMQKGTVLESTRQSELINASTAIFTNNFIAWLNRDFEIKKIEKFANPTNLFELCEAKLLVTSNSVTRSLSTKLGNLWELIANISPYVIVPEIEFGMKITGVDIILYTDNIVHFAQLKTAKGTLTGSQKYRAIKELSIHENALFLVAFNLGQWTFPPHLKIPRFAGKDFWKKIHMDYDLVESNVKNMLQTIDKAFADLATRYT